ncbi:MAG: hypothetical protein OIF38_18460 [Cellvibrionaceae bacterium]|nr:hypothetical protein [Cellvibrionaceae bacterium]
MKQTHNGDFAPLKPSQRQGLLAKRGLLLGLLALLVALLATVVFVLPNWVQPAEPEATTARDKDAPATPLSESPWQDAQLAKRRREAQDLLSQLLKAQQDLQQQQIELWAQDEYKQALALAEQADQAYRQRQFDSAQSQYQQALAQLQQQLARVPQIYSQQINRGKQALANAEIATAEAAFSLAAQLQTGNSDDKTEAERLLARAKVAEQLQQLLAKGERQQRQGRWQEALASYRSALALDTESEAAKAALENAQQTLASQDFNRHMSSAFNALETKRYREAAASFRRALALRPKASAAEAGLSQAKEGLRQQRIGQTLASAKTAAAAENWAQAQADYQKVLGLEAAEIQAKVGKIEADARLKLDTELELALAQKSQLQDPLLRQRQRQLLAQAQKISKPGQRLSKQIKTLQQNLAAAERPQQIVLRSDGLTQVQLLRSGGTLGSFKQQQLELLPGRYTALGSRSGFRDVRVEFEVVANNRSGPIEVICAERI